ncbi:Fic family protein [Actinoplanes sp. LDG1-06]|uniref:Fic family protein n=1 Tax=Paractinoplanes ovalisporus TaxID=2810368 RepID=A0ABS2AMW5_9ACTN|nr:Fic family protein [Actinoplanes ovalisporus]MBM2620571.1 Fic family protein [Actinoplanes ovalisporus]
MTIEPDDPRLRFNTLTWADVDPDRHPFDADAVFDVVRALAPAGGVPAPYRYDPRHRFDNAGHDERWNWQRAMTIALVEHYGDWARGWAAQTAGRTADGALVVRWSGAQDSITTPDETLDAVAGALSDWRTFLEELAELFERYLPLPADPRAAAKAWEATTASLVATVAARSGEDEFWHPVCVLALKWFLTVAEVPGEDHDALVDEAVGGRFWSYVSPLGAEVADAAESLAAALTGVTPPPDDAWPDTWPQDWPSRRSTELPAAERAPRILPPPVPDALATWLRVRSATRWEHATEHVTGPARTARDGIARILSNHRYNALDLVRADVAEGGPLTFARLEMWQRKVLAVTTAPFRTTPAYARDGRERYAYRDELPELFEACLAEATDPAVPLPSRAARVYLDVLHFHPFADGNARSAAHAVYFVLAREGVVLDRAAALLMTRWPAADSHGAEGLARLIAVLIQQTAAEQGK